MIAMGNAWMWLMGDLPALMDAQPVRCPGDRDVDSLRHARAASERKLKQLRERMEELSRLGDRYDLGGTCQWILELLEERGCEAAGVEQARRWSADLLDDVEEAENMEAEDPDIIAGPDPTARPAIRRLALALGSHAQGLSDLAAIELRTYRKEVAR